MSPYDVTRPQSIVQNKARQSAQHLYTQIAKFMGPTWGPPGSCWPHEPCYQGYFSVFSVCSVVTRYYSYKAKVPVKLSCMSMASIQYPQSNVKFRRCEIKFQNVGTEIHVAMAHYDSLLCVRVIMNDKFTSHMIPWCNYAKAWFYCRKREY